MVDAENHELLSHIDDMPSFRSDSDLTRLPYLSECDVDEQLPQAIDSRYFTVSELAKMDYNPDQLSILHTNIRSISLHRDELVNLCIQTQRSFDVIGISETWNSALNEIIVDIDINGYKRYDTGSISQNGGVGLYVKTSLASSSRDDLNFTCAGFETTWVEVQNKNTKNFLFCCIYRHPRSEIKTLILHLHKIIPQLINKQVFIMGDFNINLLDYSSHTPTYDFINTFLSNNFVPCINQPTRISSQSSTVIDNIFTNLTDKKIICGNILTHISDHFPQFLIMENANSSHKNLELFKRDYSSFDERSFLSDFTRLDFNYLYEDSDIDWTYNRFLEDITTLADKHVPIIKYPKKEAKLIAKPWITNRIKKMMKVRDRLLKKMKRNKSETNRQFYKKFRNHVATELKKSKLEYYHNYFAKNEKNMRKLWDGINSIIAKKTCSHSIIDKVKDVNGKLLDDSTQMASNFNEYFVNVADSINKAIPRTPNSPLRYLGSANENSLFRSPVTHFEVEDVISNLSSSKSTGPHSVPIKLLKVVKHHISHPLAELVNQSFLKGIFPSKLK